MASSPNHDHYRLFLALTLIVAALVSLRLVQIAVADSEVRKTYEDPQVSDTVVRGTIYDRNGNILAIQTPYYRLYFHLKMIDDLAPIAKLVSPFLAMSADDIVAQANRYDTYALIRRKVPEAMVSGLEEAIENAGLENQVTLEKHQGRNYPAQFHASQLIGFTDTDNHGIEGLEYSLEPQLSPYPEIGTEEVTYGEDIVLTIDIDLQYLSDVALQKIANVHDPDFAMAIVMDAKNGDILAMSSYPWYDTNDVSSSTDRQRINHAANYLYEPGSVFKIFSLAAIMQAGQADLSVPFECDGTFTFDSGNHRMVTIGCTHPHGTVNPATMIGKSCNGAVSSWALQTDDDAFYDTLEAFGFNDQYDIDLPSRTRGRIAPPSSWSGRSKATISFGQELSTTALHLVSAATAFANDGDRVLPHLVLQRKKADGSPVFERKRTVARHVMDASIAHTILGYMEGATGSGFTAEKAHVEGIEVGAKTGTAQILNLETNSYTDGTALASTIAIVPVEDPRYIIYVAAGNPKGGTIWGSNIAAPAIGEIIQAMVSQGKLVSSLSKQVSL